MMTGIIHAYSEAVSAGLIDGANGKRYAFNGNDWSGIGIPIKNQAVKFGMQGRNAGTVQAEDTVKAG